MRLNGAYQQLDELASTIAQDDDGLLPAPIGGCSTRCPQQAQRLSAKAQYLAQNTACSSSSSKGRAGRRPPRRHESLPHRRGVHLRAHHHHHGGGTA